MKRNLRHERREIKKAEVSDKLMMTLAKGQIFQLDKSEEAEQLNVLNARDWVQLGEQYRLSDEEDICRLIQKNQDNPKKYEGLFERLLETRLASALHRNGVIELLDKLNYKIVRDTNFTGVDFVRKNYCMRGFVLRSFKPIEAVESKLTLRLRGSNCVNCGQQQERIDDQKVKILNDLYDQYFNV